METETARETTTEKGFWDDAEVISSYSREQALEDGFLVDVSDAASEYGIRLPVALTSAVYADCVAWNATDSKRQTYQDQSGRLRDVVCMAAMRMRVAKARNENADTVCYRVCRVPRGGRATRPRDVTLKMVICAGDDGAPVITIMQPNED